MNHGSLAVVLVSRGARKVWLRAGVGAVTLFATLLTTGAATAAEAGEPYPLEPPDRSSPRATLATLLESVDQAIELHGAGDPEFRRSYDDAQRCIDAARIVPKAPRAVGEATLQLKEVLDRIELPPESQIPDARWVQAEGLVAWRIPHTEIELVRVDEGDQAGEFVFSASTIERVAEFYQRVKHLPYRAGKRGASYEEFRFGTESRLVGTIVARLPALAKKEVAGQLLWQSVALVLLVILAAVLAATALRIGRKYTRPVAQSHGFNRLWALVGPVTLIAVALWLRKASFDYLRIWGATGMDFRIAMTAVAYLGAAWMTAVLVTRGAEHIILAGRIERPLSQQLIRVSSRALALLLVVGWIFLGGQRLGVPLTAMVAGLGVGGLAVALAAQSTIENLIGGISLFADQPVRIGDWLRLGDRIGALEEVGLRSAKIRTRENTIITVPNAEFAKLNLENYSRKKKSLLRFSLRVPYETTCDQLRYLLAKVHAMLLEHPELEEDKADANLVGLGPDSLEIRLKAYAATASRTRFKEIRQDVFLKALAIVEDSGTTLAVPSAVEYAAEVERTDRNRAREVERQVAGWRKRGESPIPEFPGPNEERRPDGAQSQASPAAPSPEEPPRRA